MCSQYCPVRFCCHTELSHIMGTIHSVMSPMGLGLTLFVSVCMCPLVLWQQNLPLSVPIPSIYVWLRFFMITDVIFSPYFAAPPNDNFVETVIEMRKALGWVVEIPRHGPGCREALDNLKDKPVITEDSIKVRSRSKAKVTLVDITEISILVFYLEVKLLQLIWRMGTSRWNWANWCNHISMPQSQQRSPWVIDVEHHHDL